MFSCTTFFSTFGNASEKYNLLQKKKDRLEEGGHTNPVQNRHFTGILVWKIGF